MLLQSMVIGHRVFLGDDILPALNTHFRDLYSKPLRFRAPLPDFHISLLSVSCAISLERLFLHQEIKNAVWALGFGKAPDIDGFPVEFFHTFWEACSADVFTFYDEFASNSIFLKEFNQATCVLVPKRPNPTDVTHFRLISILGTPYKIIAKLLSLRLAPVMPSIINPFQVAFIKGQRLNNAINKPKNILAFYEAKDLSYSEQKILMLETKVATFTFEGKKNLADDIAKDDVIKVAGKKSAREGHERALTWL
ncbi:Transposon TX1 uncharacterized protein [Nymphaea thermarum]|nr:Transposon TX1 uncharacterized protein [Nymphaea thermarum]